MFKTLSKIQKMKKDEKIDTSSKDDEITGINRVLTTKVGSGGFKFQFRGSLSMKTACTPLAGSVCCLHISPGL